MRLGRLHSAFWPATGIALGAWEAVAVATGRPTVTEVCRHIRRRRAGQAAIVLWTAGLAYHLLRSRPPL